MKETYWRILDFLIAFIITAILLFAFLKCRTQVNINFNSKTEINKKDSLNMKRQSVDR